MKYRDSNTRVFPSLAPGQAVELGEIGRGAP